jgi:uncharacterized protein
MDKKTEKIKDGAYQNVITGMGTSLDASTHDRVKIGIDIEDDSELASLYSRDALVKAIVDKVPEAVFNNPISIVDDDDGKIYKELSRMNFFSSIVTALKYARLYNGSIIVTLYEGDDDLEKPVRALGRVSGYRVYSSGRLVMDDSDWVKEKENPYFGSVEYYRFIKKDKTEQKIHSSRISVIKGELFPDSETGTVKQEVFGLSLINLIKDGSKLFGTSISSIGNMLKENGVSVFGFDGFWQRLEIKDGENSIRKRMGLLKSQISAFRGIIQDRNDTFAQINHNFAGIPEVMRIVMAYVSSCSQIPVSILFGNMITGLSSTNEGDIRVFNELVEKTREDKLYNVMCKLISDFAKRNLGLKKDLEFEWGAVGQMTETEKTTSLNSIVDIAVKLFSMEGVVDIEDIKAFLKLKGSQYGLFINDGNK